MEEKNNYYFLLKKVSKSLKNVVPYGVRSWVKETVVGKNINSFMAEKEEFNLKCLPKGVNLIGSIRAEMGLGQSCRLVAGLLKKTEFDFSIYNINFRGVLREKDSSFDYYISETLPYAVNIFHVNPCELGNVFMQMPDAWKGHYNIAFWLWELEDFPKEWEKYCQLFDEIWAPSEFTASSIRKITDVPVKVMPYNVEVPYDTKCSRKDFDLPEDKFLYLIMYDSNSTTGRKNPQGAIEAYKRAFPVERDDCGLVIKVNNAKKEDIVKLQQNLTGYHNVFFITEVLDKERVNGLIHNVDVFISLHRAEGFGLVMAEAMLLGTPCVATNWSSNTEFMTEDAACMVKYNLIKNKKTEGLYKKGCIWADPNLEDAGYYIKKLKDDEKFYNDKQFLGKRCIKNKLNENKLIHIWKDNLANILATISEYD